jgi:hypothetical protein
MNNNIDRKHPVYTGTVFSVVDSGKGRPFALIDADDENLTQTVAAAKVAAGISQRNPGRIQCIMRYDEADNFYACKDNDDVVAGDRVTFRVRNDNRGLPQAYDVKIVGSTGKPVVHLIHKATYIDPALQLSPGVQAGVAEMAEVEGLVDEDDEEAFMSDEELEQNEVDYASYYEEN